MEGVGMDLQEQKEIIAELEAESARGKGMLDSLRANCARMASEDKGKDDQMDVAGGEVREDGGLGEG